MKNNIRFISSLLCLVLLFGASSPMGFAVNNSFAGSSSYPSYSTAHSGPSADDIRETSNANNVTYPNGNSYFSDYIVYYIDAPKKHSVNVYSKPSAKSDNPRHVYHGSRVIGIAAQSGLTCILYHNVEMEYKTGWVTTSNLSTVFPGRTVTIDNSGGRNPAANAVNIGDRVFSWSNDNFVGSQEKYVLLDSPVMDVIQFTVDYQVVNRGDAVNGEWKGPRTIYINDGSGWVAVGTFEFNDSSVVHAVVTLNSLTDIAAVAVIANCAMPWAISTRIALLDFYCY